MAASRSPGSEADAIDGALVRCRVLAAVSLLLFAPRLGGAGAAGWWAVLPSAGLLLAVNVVVAGRWARRRIGPTGRAVTGIVVDLTATVGLLIVLDVDPGSPPMVLVLLPVLEAAVRYRTLGACLSWFVAMAALAGHTILQVQQTGDGPIGELLAVGPILLLAALPVAYITSHLTVALDAAQAAHRQADQRSMLLAELVAVEAQLASLDVATVASATADACARLGAIASDVHLVDRARGLRRLASGPHDGWLREPSTRDVTLALRAGGRAVSVTVPPGWPTTLVCVANVHPQAWIVRAVLPHHAAVDLVAESLEVLCAQVSRCALNARLHEDLQARRRRLAWRADHDELTGLENRTAARRRLGRLLDRHHATWVAFVDLDGFKGVNDSLGHDAGDTVLRVVGERFRMALGDDAVPARIGGDEFLLIPTDPGRRPDELLERIQRVLARPIPVDGIRTVTVSASVGHATGSDVDQLLSAADDAMYRQKRERARFVAPDPAVER